MRIRANLLLAAVLVLLLAVSFQASGSPTGCISLGDPIKDGKEARTITCRLKDVVSFFGRQNKPISEEESERIRRQINDLKAKIQAESLGKAGVGVGYITFGRDRNEEKEYAIKLLEKLKNAPPHGEKIITSEGEDYITVNYCSISPSEDKQINEECLTKTSSNIESTELGDAPSLDSSRSASSHPSLPQEDMLSSGQRLLKRMFTCFGGGGGSRRDGGGGRRRKKGKGSAQSISKEELNEVFKEDVAMEEKEHGFQDIQYENEREQNYVEGELQDFLREYFGSNNFFMETDEHGNRKEGALRLYYNKATTGNSTAFRIYYGTSEEIEKGRETYDSTYESSSNQPPHAPEPAGHVSNLPPHASTSGDNPNTEIGIGQLVEFPATIGPR
ncbi:hypothetical protein FA10DRAFT_262485 [Acaromyces ingoldii]|uniref:Uncharacterized protein n=1 Tax=Acaromyces ingoldii TaxID=215250 RepID=A0A316YHX3_9BASI|nr:hypothetical protein FA10DRAFT_262485 [Acaromyces ingoldii]PWN87315.1 hypothetical protein FA10DRAFT_262485 [Acaromyces ingoldii]